MRNLLWIDTTPDGRPMVTDGDTVLVCESEAQAVALWRTMTEAGVDVDHGKLIAAK